MALPLDSLLQISIIALQSIWPPLESSQSTSPSSTTTTTTSTTSTTTPPSSSSSKTTPSIKKKTIQNETQDLLDFIYQVLRRSKTSPNSLKICLFYLHQARRRIRERISMADQFRSEHLTNSDSLHHPNINHSTISQLDRFQNIAKDPALSGQKMFVAALMLASKYLQDRNFSNRAWAKIAGFSIKDLNTNERVFLSLIDYRSHVHLSAFETWCGRLQKLMDEKKISKLPPLPTPGLDTAHTLPSSSSSCSLQRNQLHHSSSRSTSSAPHLTQSTLNPDSPISHHPSLSSRRPSIDQFVTPVRQQTHPLVSSRVILATAPSRLGLSEHSVQKTVDDHSSSDRVTPIRQQQTHPAISRSKLATAPPAQIKSSHPTPRLVSDITPARRTPTPIISQPQSLGTCHSSCFRPDASMRADFDDTPTKAVAPQPVSPISVRAYKPSLSRSASSLSHSQTLSGLQSVGRQNDESGFNRSTGSARISTLLDNITSPDLAQAELSLLEKMARENILLTQQEVQNSLKTKDDDNYDVLRVLSAQEIQQKQLELLAEERRLKEKERRLKEEERKLMEEQTKWKAQELRLREEEKRERLRRLIEKKPQPEPVVHHPILDRSQRSSSSNIQHRGLNESLRAAESIGTNKKVYGKSPAESIFHWSTRPDESKEPPPPEPESNKDEWDWNNQDPASDEQHRSCSVDPTRVSGASSELQRWSNLEDGSPLQNPIESRQGVIEKEDHHVLSNHHQTNHKPSRSRSSSYVGDPPPQWGATIEAAAAAAEVEEAEAAAVAQRLKKKSLERIRLSSDLRDPTKFKSSSSSPPPHPSSSCVSNSAKKSLIAKLQEEKSRYGYPDPHEANVGRSSQAIASHSSKVPLVHGRASSLIGANGERSTSSTMVSSQRMVPSSSNPSYSQYQPRPGYRGVTPPLQISHRPLNSCGFQDNQYDYRAHHSRTEGSVLTQTPHMGHRLGESSGRRTDERPGAMYPATPGGYPARAYPHGHKPYGGPRPDPPVDGLRRHDPYFPQPALPIYRYPLQRPQEPRLANYPLYHIPHTPTSASTAFGYPIDHSHAKHVY